MISLLLTYFIGFTGEFFFIKFIFSLFTSNTTFFNPKAAFMKRKSIFFYVVFVICTNTCINVRAQVNKQDSLALVDLYNSTNGPNWFINSNWLTGPVKTWFGITVIGGRVITINLWGNDLYGTIPSSIGNLANLTVLLLYNNQLIGSIPSSIGNLVNLTALSLEGNQLSGSIPSSIGNLVNLTFLNLGLNQLSGRIPSSLGNLINFSRLFLYYNRLSGSIPPSLGNLVNLQYLYLSNNELSGSIPPSLGNLVNLQDLNLTRNQLSGKIPPAIANLQQLSALDLSYNRFTFNGMELVAQTFPFAIYSNQVRIPLHQNGNALSVSAGGTLNHNTYKWFRCGKTGNTLITTITGDSVFHPSQSGIYHVKVTNSVATQLTLHSHPIKYVTPAQFVESASASSENALQQHDKMNFFSVYPNPAKNILYVQTNGNAAVSLLNQSGKILLTTNINGTGSISISGMAAGLYYLKNNETGETQKIIVIK